jgi:hypothetical protein
MPPNDQREGNEGRRHNGGDPFDFGTQDGFEHADDLTSFA